MPTSYLPSREADLVTWSNNFNTLISADPTTYGLSVEDAAAYANAHTAFVDAYQVANDPATRSPMNVEDKNTKKQALITLTREFVNIIQAYPQTTNTMRSQLGITIRDTTQTPVPVPTAPPQLDIENVYGRRMTIRLRDAATGERKKPEGVTGAAVLSYVGENIPDDIRQWYFEGNTNRSKAEITFGPTVPMGAKVWVTAFWFNRRSESGPACAPIAAHVGYGALTEGDDPSQAA